MLLGGILGSTGLIVVRPGPAPAEPPAPAPAVHAEPVYPGSVRVEVHAQGSLEPRVENDFVAEVGGRIDWVAPALETGARFAAGEVLVRIDDRDLRIAHEKAAAAVDRARHRLGLAEASHERRRSLEEAGAASSAALDEAASSAGVAAADLREARALLAAAEHDLERAVLRAPFEGRARELRIDVGEIVAPGTPVARLFAVDVAEVRLPIPDSELAFLEIPEPGTSAPDTSKPTPEPSAEPIAEPSAEPGEELDAGPVEIDVAAPGSDVILRGRFAGTLRELRGQVVGTEGALDPRTRMMTVVVRVPRPEDARVEPGVPALPMGLFMEATLLGRRFDGVVTLPRRALRGRDRVAVVDDEGRLRERPVSILRIEGERVLVQDGIAPGERVCTSPLDLAVDGMRVRVIAEHAARRPEETGAAR